MLRHEYIKGMEEAYNSITQANYKMIDLWLNNTLCTWQWWFGLTLAIVPWILWITLRKKDSTYRLLLAGLFAILISSWLDVLGILFGLWSYYDKIIPLPTGFIPYDLTLIPVSIMFILQIKPQVSPIIKAAVYATLSSFIAEPFFVWIGFYNPKHWEYIYSFPIEILIYLACDWLSKRLDFNKL